jgi:hypothetical protein
MFSLIGDSQRRVEMKEGFKRVLCIQMIRQNTIDIHMLSLASPLCAESLICDLSPMNGVYVSASPRSDHHVIMFCLSLDAMSNRPKCHNFLALVFPSRCIYDPT